LLPSQPSTRKLLAPLVIRRLQPRVGIEIAQYGPASLLLLGVIRLGMLALLAAAAGMVWALNPPK
jgi:hypothetical protein